MAATRNRGFAQKVYRWTLLGWLVLVLIHLTIYLAAFLRASPTDEVYANSILFQAAAFCLTVLPYWVLSLIAALLVQFATVGASRPKT